jgi:hypothetical protein
LGTAETRYLLCTGENEVYNDLETTIGRNTNLGKSSYQGNKLKNINGVCAKN